eukprot:CAMPEP_0178762612 /NCGR_PEP_ID=MMETSP0744-20121128/16636_2 /TAXON_ID=913974 /ORGANISM="Nitzschia punctata, Strain CCMP561" /LENGTH=53 /DNA_ID=CAMNT_0020417303 /DNA_START=297 /DNA_END=458 /DNA_ORIENTATION=-
MSEPDPSLSPVPEVLLPNGIMMAMGVRKDSNKDSANGYNSSSSKGCPVNRSTT